MSKDPTRGVFKKLTDIDLSELQIGEHLTIYRGSNSFLTGPGAAGYVDDALVLEVKNRSAVILLQDRRYKLRFKDSRICRVPNGETTMMYVHARGGRPTVTAYFTAAEYKLVKDLLRAEVQMMQAASLTGRTARTALARMQFHDRLAGIDE